MGESTRWPRSLVSSQPSYVTSASERAGARVQCSSFPAHYPHSRRPQHQRRQPHPGPRPPVTCCLSRPSRTVASLRLWPVSWAVVACGTWPRERLVCVTPSETTRAVPCPGPAQLTVAVSGVPAGHAAHPTSCHSAQMSGRSGAYQHEGLSLTGSPSSPWQPGRPANSFTWKCFNQHFSPRDSYQHGFPGVLRG